MSLRERVAELEAAILAISSAEFGDVPGHPFHGNQWGVPAGTDIVARKGVLAETHDIIVNHDTKIGTVAKTGGFSVGEQGDYESHPVTGPSKETHSLAEAVRHIVEHTRDIHHIHAGA